MDMILCNPKTHSMRFFSSYHLKRCSKTITGNLHICHGRKMALKLQKPFECNSEGMPKTVIFELPNNFFLIENSDHPMILKCPTYSKEIKFNLTSKFHLPNDCSLQNEFLFIEKSNSDTKTSNFSSTNFELINIEPLNPTRPMNSSIQLEKLNEAQANLSEIKESQAKLIELHAQSQKELTSKIEKLEDSSSHPTLISGISLGTACIVGIVLIAFAIAFCKCE